MVDGQVYCHFHEPCPGVWVTTQSVAVSPESKEGIMRNFLCDLTIEDGEEDGFGNERIKLVIDPLEVEITVACSHVISYLSDCLYNGRADEAFQRDVTNGGVARCVGEHAQRSANWTPIAPGSSR
jgi:hypothetical protein